MLPTPSVIKNGEGRRGEKWEVEGRDSREKATEAGQEGRQARKRGNELGEGEGKERGGLAPPSPNANFWIQHCFKGQKLFHNYLHCTKCYYNTSNVVSPSEFSLFSSSTSKLIHELSSVADVMSLTSTWDVSTVSSSASSSTSIRNSRTRRRDENSYTTQRSACTLHISISKASNMLGRARSFCWNHLFAVQMEASTTRRRTLLGGWKSDEQCGWHSIRGSSAPCQLVIWCRQTLRDIDDDDDNELTSWHKVLGLQGQVTVMWGHIVVSTVRRSWGRTAVRLDKLVVTAMHWSPLTSEKAYDKHTSDWQCVTSIYHHKIYERHILPYNTPSRTVLLVDGQWHVRAFTAATVLW